MFTSGERTYAAARARPARHLAARFCAKEAVAKALGIRGFRFSEVEVVATAGAPRIRLRGAAAARARQLRVTASVSLTHTGATAAAVALLRPGGEGDDAPGTPLLDSPA